MGFNAESLGFKDASDMYYFLKSSEANQLKVFVKFCEVNNLTRHLRAKNRAAFALAITVKTTLDMVMI